MPDSKVVNVVRAHRLAMSAKEAETMREMAVRWMGVERALDGNIAALANEMLRRTQAGEVITPSMIRAANRYDILKAQTEREILKYNKDAAVIISDGQVTALEQGLSTAQDAIVSSGFNASYHKINVGAVDAMVGFAGDGSPLVNLLNESVSAGATDSIVQSLIDGIGQGLGAEQVARDIAASINADQIAKGIIGDLGKNFDRSLVIARTEINRSYRSASTEQYRQSGVTDGFMRLVARDEACIACLALDGEKFDTADEMDDHPNGRAELPDNLIFTDSPTALETFRHNDYVFIIRTSSGKELTVTADHPVLTDSGWMGAAFIEKGCNVISAGGRDWASTLMRPDYNNVPSFAKDLAHTFNMVRLGSVPESTKHFYRNGEGGEIDIIFINRHLWSGYNAAFRQQLREYFFGRGGVRNAFLVTFSAIEKMSNSLKRTAKRILSVFDNGVLLRLAHINVPETIGLGERAGLDTLTRQELSNDIAGDTEMYSNLVFGFPTGEHSKNNSRITWAKNDFARTIGGNFRALDKITFGFIPEQPLSLEQVREGLSRSVPTGGNVLDTIPGKVFFDKVISVEKRFYTGHVYSLQNRMGWYVSNGIISHNCTCVPIIQGMDEPTWEKADEWLANQSEDRQREILGNTRFEMYQNGTPLSAFGEKKRDDIWGDSPKIVTLGDLATDRPESRPSVDEGGEFVMMPDGGIEWVPSSTDVVTETASGPMLTTANADKLISNLSPEMQKIVNESGVSEIRIVSSEEMKAIAETARGSTCVGLHLEDGNKILILDRPEGMERVLIHETAHVLDAMGNNGKYVISESKEWLEASGWKQTKNGYKLVESGVSNLAPTQYARKSPWEDFAETFAQANGNNFDRRVLAGESDQRYEFVKNLMMEKYGIKLEP